MACGKLVVIVLVAAGLLLTACERQTSSGAPAGLSASPTAPARSGPAPVQPPVTPEVIGDRAVMPPGCQPDEIVRLVSRFFDAVSRGDQAQIDQTYAITAGPAGLKPQGWYSVSWSLPGQEPRHFTAYTQDDLLAYFRERQMQHERLRLASLQVRAPTWHGGVDVTYTLSRSADDLAEGDRLYGGKGAINCTQQRIFVWSMTDAAQPPAP